MLTFQDFQRADDKAAFIKKLIGEHEGSDLVTVARDADEYDRQKNVMIRDFVQTIFSASGQKIENVVASNNKRSSNFFRRLNVQRCMYSLGNGVTFASDETKKRLGESTFDTILKQGAYKALIHGVVFMFLNVDHVHVFPVTEFAPLWDEDTGALRAGVRYWRIDEKKPGLATLYEEDGYTEYRAEKGNDYKVAEEKRAYKLKLSKAKADSEATVTGAENYGGKLPVVPMWGSELKQSTLVGMKDGIDNYDLISNGWCNDLSDCAQVYWLIENYGGMSKEDQANFRARLLYEHVAGVDTADGGKVTPYTQEIPFAAREAYLNMLREDIYSDYGGLNVKNIGASAKTATEIDAAYQPLDENADDFEYQIIEGVQRLLRLIGIEDTPQFKRNRIANQTEQIEAVMAMASYLDEESVLDLLPNITPEMKNEILRRRNAQALTGLTDENTIDEAIDKEEAEG